MLSKISLIFEKTTHCQEIPIAIIFEKNIFQEYVFEDDEEESYDDNDFFFDELIWDTELT